MLRYFASGYRDFDKHPDPPSQRLNWEFFAVSKGSCVPVISGSDQEFRVQKSTLWLLPSQLEYRWKGGVGPCYRSTFHFSTIPEVIERLVQGKSFLSKSLSSAETAKVTEMANMLKPYYLHPTEALYLHSMRVLYELSILITEGEVFQSIQRLDSVEWERVSRAEIYYRKNIKRRPKIDEIAYALKISSSLLRQDFTKVHGMSPGHFFQNLRLDEACRLLSDTDMTIDQIVAMSGFNSEVDFHRLFKKVFKTTPHQWRRGHVANPDMVKPIPRF
jgi:AraC-like DNA-binding protein